MSFMLCLTSKLRGRRIGTDRFGNAYYQGRRLQAVYNRHRRWVVYAGAPDPTGVPPEWHAWLHHLVDAPLPEGKLYPWQREHQRNLTGTPEAYRPAGHDYKGGRRQASAADYDAWTPGA